jgi:hypothetical protein
MEISVVQNHVSTAYSLSALQPSHVGFAISQKKLSLAKVIRWFCGCHRDYWCAQSGKTVRGELGEVGWRGGSFSSRKMWRESIHGTPLSGLKFLVYYKTWQNCRFTTADCFVFSCHLAILNVNTGVDPWDSFKRPEILSILQDLAKLPFHNC